MYERFIKLIGENNLNKIKNKTVLIVGLGGVGGTALEALARSGINNFVLYDGDVFEESNLNRQILSNNTNIGQNKAFEAYNRVKSINPSINILYNEKFLNEANIYELKDIDYIVDACDDINAKILLIKYALDNNIKIISSMGVGKRLNPSMIEISRLDKTYNDALAKKLRYLLKKEAISTKIPVVYSKENSIDTGNVIGSSIFVASTAGIYLAYYVINDIINKSD